jgi:beta-glucosidase
LQYGPFSCSRSENGIVCPNENELSREEAVEDDFRIGYLESYADQIALKIAEGIPIKSYLMWAWTDNFECGFRGTLSVRASGC